MHTSSNKDYNHRSVYERLKKDFANFFSKDAFYSNGSNSDFKDKSPISASKTCGAFSPKPLNEKDLNAKRGKNTIE